ncbi:MAG: nucleotidyltransferase [Nitrospinota bacterium]|nr:MAG: nucleotidyltransferase [Nitrospinota bacterium]
MGRKINIPREEIARFCRRHRIRRLSLFGSVLREDFGPESDVDVLVEFEPGARVGLIGFARIENELSRLLGRKVDLNTAGFLSPYFREEVLREAEAVYDEQA